MGSLHEIVEVKDEPNLTDLSKNKEKKPQGCSRYLEDDINKLFEAINFRNSFNGSSYSDETGATTPRKNPSKKPMRMSLSSSSGIGYNEPVSLKQALRGLCISQASEMAAIKRLSLPYNNSAQSTPRLNLEKSTKSAGPIPTVKLNEFLQEPESGSQTSNETVQEKKIISLPSPTTRIQPESSLESVNSEVKTVNNREKNNLPPNKSTLKPRYKGKSTRASPRPVKTVIRTKNIVKKKSKHELTSASNTINPKSGLDTSHPICQKCNCAIKDEKTDPKKVEKTVSPLSTRKQNGPQRKVNTLTGYGQNDLTQSSNSSSICEYSSSTSISDERNSNNCIIINRPHMSKDIRWQAINQIMNKYGFLGLRHFNLLKKLGCGDIGTVYLAELIGTNFPFAIKVMDNEFLERRQKMPRAHMEREILSILDHPFLPTLYAHFVSENLSCLVMEYCPGGDLHVLRQKQPARFFHEQAARFYVAEVLLALEYLHMLGIVYRDLKPENILVREDGHIMVTDFDLSLRCSVNPILMQSQSTGPLDPPRMSGPCAGSSCIDPFCMRPACQVSCFRPRLLRGPKTRKPKPDPARSLPQLVAEPTEARSNSFVGTHEYLAPEIIKGEGHGSAVDWWTFGVFLYELLYGKTPFKGPGNDETLANVVLESLRFPETPLVSFQARDLIKLLLVKEPENRLGSQRGAAEIKQHPFFDGLNWALIRCASPPELPEPYDVMVSKAASLEKAKKYLDYNESSEGHLEFELF